MKLNTNSLVIGDKTYNLENNKYAFVDAVTAICTVLCSTMAGAGTDYDLDMTIPLEDDNETRFSVTLDGRQATLSLNDKSAEEGDISEIIKEFIRSAEESSKEYTKGMCSGVIRSEAAADIRDDLDTLADTLEEFEYEYSDQE